MAQFRPKQLAHLDPKSVAQIRPFYPGATNSSGRDVWLATQIYLVPLRIFRSGENNRHLHSIYNHSKQPQSIRIKLLYLLFINGFYRVDQPFGQRKVFCNDFGFPLHILFERQRPAVIGHQRIGQCHSPDIGRVGDS